MPIASSRPLASQGWGTRRQRLFTGKARAILAGGPLVMLFLCAGLLALPLSALPGLDAALPQALDWLYSLLLEGGRLLARAPAVILAGGA